MKHIVRGADDAVGAWIMGQMGANWTPGRGTAIGLAEGSQLIAGMCFEGFNGRSLMTHCAAVDTRAWLSREYIYLCFAYPFFQLGASKLIAPVAESNLQCIRFVEKTGFVLEATLTEAHPTGNLLLYTMRSDTCRWLKLKDRLYGQAQCTGSD